MDLRELQQLNLRKGVAIKIELKNPLNGNDKTEYGFYLGEAIQVRKSGTGFEHSIIYTTFLTDVFEEAFGEIGDIREEREDCREYNTHWRRNLPLSGLESLEIIE